MRIITTHQCQSKVSKRDRLFEGSLYLDRTPSGVNTFYVRFTTPFGKRETVRLGVYDRAHFTQHDARAMASELRAQVRRGVDVMGERRQIQSVRVQRGKTVNESSTRGSHGSRRQSAKPTAR